jgi:aquaporin Z
MQKKLFAEFLGTFWLVFGGCGSAIFAAAFPSFGIGF